MQTDKQDWSFSSYGSNLSDPAQKSFYQGQAALVLFPSIKDDFSILYGDRAVERIDGLVSGL